MNHLAIIMDGNGRWAERQGLMRTEGHRAGAATAERIIEHAAKADLKTLSLFAFSCENWKRPVFEVSALMKLLEIHLSRRSGFYSEHNVRLHFIGDRAPLPLKTREVMAVAEAKTRAHSGLNLVLAVNYSGQMDLMQAMRAARVPEEIEQHLSTARFGNPDLILRTGGEKRLSNFFLWQAAYSEISFSEKMWPDYSAADLDQALATFAKTERRFGGLARAQETSLEQNRHRTS